MSKLREMIKRIIKEESRRSLNENEQEELAKAKKYLDDMIDIHKTPNKIHRAILDNLVNANVSFQYRASNGYIQKVWDEFKRRFPS